MYQLQVNYFIVKHCLFVSCTKNIQRDTKKKKKSQTTGASELLKQKERNTIKKMCFNLGQIF